VIEDEEQSEWVKVRYEQERGLEPLQGYIPRSYVIIIDREQVVYAHYKLAGGTVGNDKTLTLTKGMEIIAVREYEDGWCEGVVLDTEETGIFPKTYTKNSPPKPRAAKKKTDHSLLRLLNEEKIMKERQYTKRERRDGNILSDEDRYRCKVIDELVATELKFGEALRLMVKVFANPLLLMSAKAELRKRREDDIFLPSNYESDGENKGKRSSNDSFGKRDSLDEELDDDEDYPVSSLTDQTVAKIFGNMQELINYSSVFLKKLQEESSRPFEQQMIGKVLMKYIPQMETAYATYCGHHQGALDLVTELQKNPDHVDFARWLLNVQKERYVCFFFEFFFFCLAFFFVRLSPSLSFSQQILLLTFCVFFCLSNIIDQKSCACAPLLLILFLLCSVYVNIRFC